MKTKLLALGLAARFGLARPWPRRRAPAHRLQPIPWPPPPLPICSTDPALRAIFEKHLPEIVANPQIDQGRALTLPEIVQYVPENHDPGEAGGHRYRMKALPPQ